MFPSETGKVKFADTRRMRKALATFHHQTWWVALQCTQLNISSQTFNDNIKKTLQELTKNETEHKVSFYSGFMVNTSFIGSGANQIGMQLRNWQACYRCGQAHGACTAVQGGSPYDQFSSFRSNSLASLLATAGSNCNWLGSSIMTEGSVQYPVQQVECDYLSGQLSVTLRLNATAFGVIPTLSVLSLVNSGQFSWLPGSLTGNAVSVHGAGVL